MKRWYYFFLVSILALTCGCEEDIRLFTAKETNVLLKVRVIGDLSPEKFNFTTSGIVVAKQPEIIIESKAVVLESQNRRIIIEGAERIAADSLAVGWITDIKVEGNKLILNLYSDYSYAIRINKDYHELPLIKKYQALQ